MVEKTITIKADIPKILGLYDNGVLSDDDAKSTLKEFSKEELIETLMAGEDPDFGDDDEDDDLSIDDEDLENDDEDEIEETHKPEPKVIDTQAKEVKGVEEVTEDEDDSEEDLDFLDE